MSPRYALTDFFQIASESEYEYSYIVHDFIESPTNFISPAFFHLNQVESTTAYQGEHSKAAEVPFLSEYLNSTGPTLDVVEILYFNDNELDGWCGGVPYHIPLPLSLS
jgi:hypothetical protein